MTETNTPRRGYVFGARLEDCPPNRPIYVEILDRKLVFVRTVSGQVRCLDAICPHAGACLAGGQVADHHLICPQHLLRFELDTGRCPDAPELTADCYPTLIEEGRVYVRLTPRKSPPPGE
jgi:nitrite reductase/ring-hydroxylating ferredoxin subunit